ncbi:hypothetical protein OBBRIDRAFT_801725 [Obba rivulosa]|uniref:Uncharacterized protein n=1 Tax=Obba rivulosa TaxID=1052685 RepID=A0A8E2DQ01_9APHY|nr:hypothetical protein OBBRIDRAFT_801725 [Obba rivulosa]
MPDFSDFPHGVHANLSRNVYKDLVLVEPLTRLPTTFAVTQVRAFCRLDDFFRRENGSLSGLQFYPGGYDDFVRLWNTDPNCRFGFAEFDPLNGVCILSSRPAIGEDRLAPLPKPKVIQSGIDLPHQGMQAVIRSLAESQTRSYQARDRIGAASDGRAPKRGKFYQRRAPFNPRSPSGSPFLFASPEPPGASAPSLFAAPPSAIHPEASGSHVVERGISRSVRKGKRAPHVDEHGIQSYDSDEDAEGEKEQDENMEKAA